jgi:peroxiredoxin
MGVPLVCHIALAGNFLKKINFNMIKLASVFCIFLLFFLTAFSNTQAQACFDAYDQLFKAENDTLSYNEFHKLELNFLDKLCDCPAPYFEGTTLDGNDIYLSALENKVVVLNFWFTTCLPCLKEIPELNKLAANYQDADVVFIGLARDTPEKLEAFFKRFGSFNYQIIPESYAIATQYKVVGWPQSMVIDRQGKIFKAWAGVDKNPVALVHDIENAIDECLENEH